MAYISKEQVQEKRRLISALCKEYGVTATVSGSNSSTLTVTIRKGKIDFLGNHVDTARSNISQVDWVIDHAHWRKIKGFMTVNPCSLNLQLSGIALEFVSELLGIMKLGHHDNFNFAINCLDCAWYLGINVGEWNKPYVLTM